VAKKIKMRIAGPGSFLLKKNLGYDIIKNKKKE